MNWWWWCERRDLWNGFGAFLLLDDPFRLDLMNRPDFERSIVASNGLRKMEEGGDVDH